MAVAYNSVQVSDIDNDTPNPMVFTYDPSAVLRGILVFCFAEFTSTDTFTGVRYDTGGLNRSLVTDANWRAVDNAGEVLQVKAFFLGTGLRSDHNPVNIAIDHTGHVALKMAVIIGVTADKDTEIIGLPHLFTGDGTLAEQSIDTGTRQAMRFAGLFSGLAANPAAGANSTVLVDVDGSTSPFATGDSITVVRETNGGSGNRPVGFSSGTSDDRAGVHLAIAEVLTTDLAATPIVLDLGVPAPVLSIPVTIAPGPILFDLGVPAPLVTQPIVLTPGAITLDFGVPTPTLDAPVVFSVGPIGLELGVPEPDFDFSEPAPKYVPQGPETDEWDRAGDLPPRKYQS